MRITGLSDVEWQLRVLGATTVEPALKPPMLEDLDKDGRFVTQEQFDSIDNNASIQAKLCDQQLRDLVSTVDSAKSRDAALSAAMANPHFAAFCEEILDIVSPV